jgi:hypothetical protein
VAIQVASRAGIGRGLLRSLARHFGGSSQATSPCLSSHLVIVARMWAGRRVSLLANQGGPPSERDGHMVEQLESRAGSSMCYVKLSGFTLWLTKCIDRNRVQRNDACSRSCIPAAAAAIPFANSSLEWQRYPSGFQFHSHAC